MRANLLEEPLVAHFDVVFEGMLLRYTDKYRFLDVYKLK